MKMAEKMTSKIKKYQEKLFQQTHIGKVIFYLYVVVACVFIFGALYALMHFHILPSPSDLITGRSKIYQTNERNGLDWWSNFGGQIFVCYLNPGSTFLTLGSTK